MLAGTETIAKIAEHWLARFERALGETDDVRTITILSGTLWFGIDESLDESKLTPYTAGTFFTETLARCDFRRYR
jgi:hypothetical protein